MASPKPPRTGRATERGDGQAGAGCSAELGVRAITAHSVPPTTQTYRTLCWPRHPQANDSSPTRHRSTMPARHSAPKRNLRAN